VFNKIVWTSSAKNDYFKILDYLNSNWGRKSARKFSETVTKQIELISRMPRLYPVTEARKDVRRCVVAKQVSLYYQESKPNNEIIILCFFDNRRNPDSLTRIIQ
jgi:plasmid stabilization system protein ParE